MKKFEADHLINKKILSDFIANHEELKEFCFVLSNMVGKINTGSKICISVGKKIDDGFQCYLCTDIEEPKITLNHYNNEPMFVFGSRFRSAATINIALISDFEFEYKIDDGSRFDIYNIYFKYIDGVEYSIRMVIDK